MTNKIDTVYNAFTKNKFDNLKYVWTTDNFSSLMEVDAHKNIPSPLFPIRDKGLRFQLKICPYTDRIYVLFHSTSPAGIEEKCTVTLSIQNTRHKSKRCTTLPENFEFSFLNGHDEDYIRVDDKVTIICEILILVRCEITCENAIKVSKPKLAEHFGALLETKEFSDVEIVTGDGHKIQAHRCILSARSTVFAAMLKLPMQEKQLACITIEDFNEKVIEEMLRFMYTDRMPDMSDDIAGELLAVAEKYDLDRLKTMCAHFLRNNLSVDNAPRSLKLADLYNAEELKSCAVEFIKDHFDKVCQTTEWNQLLTTDKNVILESFIEQKFVQLHLSEEVKTENDI